MNLAVVGTGLVSPGGFTPRDHAFFLRAGAPPGIPSPFLLPNDEPMPVGFCPWIGAEAPMAERFIQLATMAIDDALLPITEARGRARVRVVLCAGPPRPGLTDDHLKTLERALASYATGTRVTVVSGAAEVFRVLREADELLGRDAEALAVVGVESFVAVEALAERERCPPSPWRWKPPMPSEGAAALVVMTPTQARRALVPTLAMLDYAAVAQGSARDDNEEPVDGGAMGALLWQLPAGPPILSAFGQHEVDTLRELEWKHAVARSHARFDPGCAMTCVERTIGSIGAAAGAVNLAYAIAALRHDTVASADARRGRFAAWAISRDGKRGLATGKVEP